MSDAEEDYGWGREDDVDEEREGSGMRMPFGKYKGEELDDLPTSYLQWIAENIDGNAKLVEEAELQLTMREGKGVVRGKLRD